MQDIVPQLASADEGKKPLEASQLGALRAGTQLRIGNQCLRWGERIGWRYLNPHPQHTHIQTSIPSALCQTRAYMI